MLKVFIVDDAPAIRQRLQLIVQDSGEFSVVGQAGTLQAAIRGIKVRKPDVVLLDLHLPDGSGLELLKQFGSSTHKPVIIVLSNNGFSQYKERCLELGAALFLDKSTEFVKLGQSLQSLFPLSVN